MCRASREAWKCDCGSFQKGLSNCSRCGARRKIDTLLSLREEVAFAANDGNRDRLRELIERCKADPDGYAILSDAIQRCKGRTALSSTPAFAAQKVIPMRSQPRA
jgi:hypothetical protein